MQEMTDYICSPSFSLHYANHHLPVHPDIDGASCPLTSESICPGGFDRKILLYKPPQGCFWLE
jgi:hypothetical protein